ncbi:hypothetical protein HanRHA438_Chr03g0097801 [Helianthus annuus]|uniref:DUF7642 domain-containing protein n=1 Tax=Helianthus annuus TaxID=4232 RepID=A0A251V609_HELAN|nr:uncharacterized protein LOC110928436 [Helianthus annuus]KAF5812459.1 hypothetical protein HanXRQr2_Chr03g0086671 [Helianthus annuus]KAJ0495599.1 hypothetical protein HanIR_Chr12g0610741 [Helianthus annuus]KAJ0591411.1 hypothetical protein HanHA300_Chr03g0073041 [Helianthus annuus]KAJ0606299.1 hypothetical protein HanHA89_Chr03g0083561 [Helianthus annuus]KAJ0766393.1 hypothetical protein HanLR1_Chr03g0077091 [Helianthus annuus]
MGSRDGEMEKGLLCEGEDEEVLYSASFLEAEDGFIKLKTTQWILYSLLLMLAWGLGLAMLLYLPLRRYILRTMIRSRNLYITPDAIVYKVTKPLPFPCFGVLKKEKHVLLASVADVVIEQGYLQSQYGVYSIRIENVDVRRPPSDDVQIEGVTNPQAFRKAVLTRLSDMRTQALSCILEDAATASSENFQSPMANAGEFAILQKLDEVGNSLKRVQSLIEERQPKTSD